MSKEKRAFLIRSMLIAMLLTLFACLGMAGALAQEQNAQDGAETAVVRLDVDGYLLEFEDLLPPSITYEAAADTPWPDLIFSVDLEAAVAEGEATAAAVRAAQAAADGRDEPKAETGVKIVSKDKTETAPEAEEQTEGPENQPQDEKAEEAPENLPVPIFTMELGADEGDWVVVLMDETGDVLPVAFYMAQAPEGLEDKQATAFMLAQEDVQVLLATLKLKSLPGEGEAGESEATLQAQDVELSFSAEIADVVSIREADGRFEFYTDVAGEETVVYSLTIGSEEGDIVMMLTDAQGGQIPAAINMEACPEDLSREERMSFFMAQETVAEIMGTLALK